MPTMPNDSLPLERYGHNLTRLAKLGAFSPLTEQEARVNRVFQILQRNQKDIPLILAADETSRWALVAEVIRRMARGEAPSPLLTQQVIGLDYEALFTDLSDDPLIRQQRRKPRSSPFGEKLLQVKPDSDEEWAWLAALFRWPSLEEWIAPTIVLERLQSVFVALHQAAGSFVLYVDHFHRLIGGEPQRYPFDAATLLKPALNRDRIKLMGACTLEQYRQSIERDASIERRCQIMCLPEASEIG